MALSKKKPAKVEKKAAKPEPKKEVKKPAKKPAKQAAPRKAAEKITPKKAEAKPKDIKVKKAGKSGAKVFTPSKEKEGKRVYHISNVLMENGLLNLLVEKKQLNYLALKQKLKSTQRKWPKTKAVLCSFITPKVRTKAVFNN